MTLLARGEKTRRLQGNGGQTIKVSRTYGSCPKCGQCFFPLDDELALLPGQLAPRQQNHLVHLASHMPFATATTMMEALLDVHVSKESARRMAERMGQALEQAQTEAADTPFPEEPGSSLDCSRLAMSADGAMIGLQTGEWVEVRTLVIGELPPEEKKKKACQQEPRVQKAFRSWQKWKALSQQRTRRRQHAAQHRVEKRLLRHNHLLLTSPSLPPPPLPTPDPLPVAPAVQIRSGSSRPSAHHPWRRPFKPG